MNEEHQGERREIPEVAAAGSCSSPVDIWPTLRTWSLPLLWLRVMSVPRVKTHGVSREGSGFSAFSPCGSGRSGPLPALLRLEGTNS